MCNKELKFHQKKEYIYIYREREREREFTFLGGQNMN